MELGLLEQMAQVNPITMADYPTPAQRPSYSLLECSGSRKALDLPSVHWRQALRQLLECSAIVRSDGKSASIKSISECIQSSNASSFSICTACTEQGISLRSQGPPHISPHVTRSNPSPKAMCSALKRSCLAVSGIVIWSNRQETKEITITMSCRST